MTQKFVRETLARAGLGAVVSGEQLADVLNLHVRTILRIRSQGRFLQPIDRNTYDLDTVVDWLCANPRYMTRITR